MCGGFLHRRSTHRGLTCLKPIFSALFYQPGFGEVVRQHFRFLIQELTFQGLGNTGVTLCPLSS